MSNTRKAESGKPLKQERYSSSAEYDRGLMANLVARRCSVLDSAEDRDLIYFLQLLSHREGGLKKVSSELLERFGDRIGTKSMRQYGTNAGQIYNADQVRAVRGESDDIRWHKLPLRGEWKNPQETKGRLESIWRPEREPTKEELREAAGHPSGYPAKVFIAVCREAARQLEDDLNRLCLDPAFPIESGPWYFHELSGCLREYQHDRTEAIRKTVVTTELGKLVFDTLDYALETKCLVLIEGIARTGKTFAAKTWCELNSGRARYVQVPSTNDEIGFYRAIAKSLGVSINLNSKAQELRQRVEEVLQQGDLLLCLDESHYCWPNLVDPRSVPTRINWLMTALVNYDVPVALISTPQFLKTQKVFESKTRWAADQFTGRLGHFEKLPHSLSEKDLIAVAESVLPEGDDKAIEILVRYAQGSAKYLAGIESIVRRARYLAGKDRRTQASRSDIKRAVSDSVIPSDSALAQVLAEPVKRGGRGRSLAPFNEPLTPDLEGIRSRSGAVKSTAFVESDAIEISPRRGTVPARSQPVSVTG